MVYETYILVFFFENRNAIRCVGTTGACFVLASLSS